MLNTTLSLETMLAERNWAFSSAGPLHDPFSTSAYQASRCFFTLALSRLSTRFFTNPLRVDRAMIRTFEAYHDPNLGAKDFH